jgi:hypothetical protein
MVIIGRAADISHGSRFGGGFPFAFINLSR